MTANKTFESVTQSKYLGTIATITLNQRLSED